MTRRTKFGLKKKFRDNSNLRVIDKPRGDYDELHKDLVRSGLAEVEADLRVEQVKEQEKAYEDAFLGQGIPTDKNIQIRIQYGLDEIRGLIDWDKLSQKEKCDVLWSIGFNTKRHHYYIETREYTKNSGERAFGEVVFGQERLDNEWLTKTINGKNVASLDARLFNEKMMEHTNSRTIYDATVDAMKKRKRA